MDLELKKISAAMTLIFSAAAVFVAIQMQGVFQSEFNSTLGMLMIGIVLASAPIYLVDGYSFRKKIAVHFSATVALIYSVFMISVWGADISALAILATAWGSALVWFYASSLIALTYILVEVFFGPPGKLAVDSDSLSHPSQWKIRV